VSSHFLPFVLDSYQIPPMSTWRELELDGVYLLAELRDGWEGYTMTRIIPAQVHMPISTLLPTHPKLYSTPRPIPNLNGSHLLVRCSATYLMDLEISLSQSLRSLHLHYSHSFHTIPTMFTTPSSSSLRSDTHLPFHSQSLRSTHCSLRPQTADNSVSQP
jgi:hypothetical protein